MTHLGGGQDEGMLTAIVVVGCIAIAIVAAVAIRHTVDRTKERRILVGPCSTCRPAVRATCLPPGGRGSLIPARRGDLLARP